MNKSADDLLQQLGGLGSDQGALPAAGARAKRSPSNLQSPEEMDQWRILLIDLVYLLNASFRDAHYWEGVKAEKDTFRQFINILHELNQMPDQDGRIKIVFRGSRGAKVPTKSDYVIRFGKLNVDVAATSAIIKRMGIRLKHIKGRLIKAFEVLSSQGIESLFLTIPDSSNDALEHMRISLRIVSCFKKAVSDKIPVEYTRHGMKHSLMPMLNEARQPDPNMTLLAAVNDLSSDKLQVIVQKVSALMKRPDFARGGIRSASVYQTIFRVKSLKRQIRRPPIEINSTRAVHGFSDQNAAGAGQEIGGRGIPGHIDGQAPGPEAGVDPAQSDLDPAELKANIAKIVKQTYRSSPEMASGAMNTIYSDDYKQIDPTALEGRLHQISDLLVSLQKSENGQQVLDAVVEQIQAGIDQIPTDVLDDLVVQDDVIKIWDGDGEKVIGQSDDNVIEIIETSKERASDRRKTRTVFRPFADFTAEDIKKLSAYFDISSNDAQEIVKLFNGCFDGQGNFQKTLFEKKMPEIAQYPKKIFSILWEFLRKIPHRSDRLAFLNSLQLLTNEIQQPKQAIKVLLGDFLLEPNQTQYPDRNAIMLATQFLRSYNKEINMDIEITPEEVLLVQSGMNESVKNYVAWKVNGEKNKIIEKAITIRKKLLESLELDGSDASLLPVRFLLALEREVHMFLSLVGGDTAAMVIKGALKVYGNPDSKVYLLKGSRKYLSGILQHLAVLIRGMGRVGRPDDFDLLDEIRNRQDTFLRLSDEPRHRAQVQRTLGWIDGTKKEISQRTKAELI